jgi:LPXTG-motif cell wall-anchored protein
MALTYDKLNETQKKNAALINAALTKYGITNPYFRAGVLSVVSKESEFTPISEGFRYTLKRLREVFSPYRLQNKSDAELTKLLKVQNGYVTDGVALFNLIYGGKWGAENLGNTQAGDGYKYRGRGFNQNTGRSNYTNLSNKMGIDLVSNPDKMNDPAVAAEALAVFFANGLKFNNGEVLKRYGVIGDQSKIDTLRKGTDIAYNINAGVGKKNIAADTTGGYKKTLDSMSSYFKSLGELTLTETQKKMGFGLLGILVLAGGVYYYLKKKNKI